MSAVYLLLTNTNFSLQWYLIHHLQKLDPTNHKAKDAGCLNFLGVITPACISIKLQLPTCSFMGKPTGGMQRVKTVISNLGGKLAPILKAAIVSAWAVLFLKVDN